MNGMRWTMAFGLFAVATLPCGCVQLGSYDRSSTFSIDSRHEGHIHGYAVDDPSGQSRGRPYGRTRARLQFFREELEFVELDLDFDNAPDADILDTERDLPGRCGGAVCFGGGVSAKCPCGWLGNRLVDGVTAGCDCG